MDHGEKRREAGRDYVRWLDGIWSERLQGARNPKPDLSIGILLWPTFPLMSLTGAVEPLRHAADFGDHSRPVHCRWRIMGEPGHVAQASCGVAVRADAPYVNPRDFDYVMAIGGLLPNLRDAPHRHRHYLHAAAEAGVPLIGVCTGAFVLAQEGLLAGRRVCVHPYHQTDFEAAFPGMAISTRDDFLIENRRITVPGGVSILSLMAELIRSHCGADRAAKVAHQLSLAQRREASGFEKAQAAGFRRAADPRVQKAVTLIESRMGQGVAPEAVARQIGLGARQFGRLFRAELGTTPKRFILDTRLRYARWLVENSALSITAIAFQTGFADSAHLATAFKARYGTPPSGLR